MKFSYCEGRSEPNRAYLRTCDLEMIIVMSSNPHFVCRESMEKKEKLFVEGRDLYLVSKSYQVNLNIWKETIAMFTTMVIRWKLHDLSI